MKVVAIACFFAAGLGIALAAAEDPKREDPPEDKSLVIGKQKSKVENGSAFDKGIVELGKRKRLAIPENAEVIHKGEGTKVEVFMKKTMNFGGHPPRPMSIRVARKYMGCATKDEDGLLQLATYGEWSTKEGGGRIRLVLVVPEKIEVVRQKALSGPKSIAHPPPGQPPPKPATDEEKDSYRAPALGWKVVAAVPDFDHRVAGDDAARAVVARAVMAHGGPDKLAKLRIMRVKVEGSMIVAPGQPDVAFVIEDWWQMPDQYKSITRFELGGKKVSQSQAIDGQAGWIEINGNVQAMPKEAVAEMREQKYAEDLDRLGFLGNGDLVITSLGASDVGMFGVLVRSKGHKDVKLYFGKQSGRLLKREHPVLDAATGKDIVQEVIFGDYKDTDGVPHYRTIAAYRGGKKFVEAKVVEIEFFDKLDKKVFAKP